MYTCTNNLKVPFAGLTPDSVPLEREVVPLLHP